MSTTKRKHQKTKTNNTKISSPIEKENELIIREATKIVEALGKMFAPCCEVVLHDLRKPNNSIVSIECNLSGRQIGQSTSEMGLARIKDTSFPDIVQNYANSFADGRPVKSTSIGLKNSEGKFIAAICLNLDISLFSSIQRVTEQLISTDMRAAPVRETLRSRSVEDLRESIENFAVQHNLQPRNLTPEHRREIVQLLANKGLLQLRGAASIAADILGISRASIYNALRK